MSHATHSNAALTPRARLKMAKLIVDENWDVARAAERYDVSWKTAKKWADRYEAEGPAGMFDRSSRPHHQPNRTPQRDRIDDLLAGTTPARGTGTRLQHARSAADSVTRSTWLDACTRDPRAT